MHRMFLPHDDPIINPNIYSVQKEHVLVALIDIPGNHGGRMSVQSGASQSER